MPSRVSAVSVTGTDSRAFPEHVRNHVDWHLTAAQPERTARARRKIVDRVPSFESKFPPGSRPCRCNTSSGTS